MNLLASMSRGWGGILVGVGVAVVVPTVLPLLGSAVGSLVRAVVKGVVIVSDQAVTLAGSALEQVDGLVAEVKADGDGTGNGAWAKVPSSPGART